MKGLCTEGNLHFKINGASLIDGRKFTIFALFYFVKLRAISKYKTPRRGGGGLYLEGLIFGILQYTIVSHVTTPVLCWSAIGANSEVALQSETILIGNAWSFSSVISS